MAITFDSSQLDSFPYKHIMYWVRLRKHALDMSVCFSCNSSPNVCKLFAQCRILLWLDSGWFYSCRSGIFHWRWATWWRHQMETFPTLLALFEGNPPVTDRFPSQRPAMRRFDVFFDLRLNKRLSKQSRRRWFETHDCPSAREVSLKGLGKADWCQTKLKHDKALPCPYLFGGMVWRLRILYLLFCIDNIDMLILENANMKMSAMSMQKRARSNMTRVRIWFCGFWRGNVLQFHRSRLH